MPTRSLASSSARSGGAPVSARPKSSNDVFVNGKWYTGQPTTTVAPTTTTTIAPTTTVAPTTAAPTTQAPTTTLAPTTTTTKP